MNDLLPCPFCQTVPEIITIDQKHTMPRTTAFKISCSGTKDARHSRLYMERVAAQGGAINETDTKNWLIKDWNKLALGDLE